MSKNKSVILRFSFLTDYAAVINALRTADVDTPLGKIRFDERGDAIGVGFSMYRVIDGVYVEVK
jgi:branched-chain amino acid transport system substrate-binding protein